MTKESNPQPPIVVTKDQKLFAFSVVKHAFTEWDRRYREEPERFQSEAEHLLKETPETYGDACAPYFMKLVEEVKSGKIAS